MIRVALLTDDRARPTIARAAAYQTSCIGHAELLFLANIARNSPSELCGYSL
jgi:hypothetical protein